MDELYPVTEATARRAWLDNDAYQAMYQRSVEDPEGFWSEQAE